MKHQHKHATDWYAIHKIAKVCTCFDPNARPRVDELMPLINDEPSVSSFDIHLKVHQDSSMEEHDLSLAQLAQLTGTIPCNVSCPDNDGTNACVFLSVQLAHEIHKLKENLALISTRYD